MNLLKFKFPQLNDADVVWGIRADKELLAEAKKRGFYCGNTPYNKLFSDLFFIGGQLNFKQDLPEDFKIEATKHFKALARSFAPKHEEKEAICALLLSELVVEKIEEAK